MAQRMRRMQFETHRERMQREGSALSTPVCDPSKIQIVQAESPLGIMVQTQPRGESTTIQVMPRHDGAYLIRGVRSHNGPFEVWIERIEVGSDIPRNAGGFDSAAYALKDAPKSDAELAEHRGYYLAPWGVITRLNPMVLTFKAVGTPCALPFLSWTLYGIEQRLHEQACPAGPAGPAGGFYQPPTAPVAPGCDQVPATEKAGDRIAAQRERLERLEQAAKRYPELQAERRPSLHAWGIPKRR